MKRAIPALAFLLAMLGLSPVSLSQTKTVVSATVVDPNGVPYAGGSVATQLVPTGGTPTINNVPVNVQNNPAAIDANGRFTISLWCNTAGGACTPFDQAGTQWQFTITNPGAQPPVGFGGVSFTLSVTITGTTQDLSSTLSAAAVPLYRDSGAAGGGCTVSGAAGNLLFVNGAATGCSSSAKLNYATGSDTLTLTPANQTLTATALVLTGSSTYTETVGSASPVTPGSVTQRAVTITSDTILNTDRGNRVAYNSASAVAVSIPTAGSSGFAGGFNVRLSNQNTGVVTVTPVTGTVNGSPTLVLQEGQDCFFTPSISGTSWAADCNEPQMTAGTGVTFTRGVHSLTISATGSGGTVTSVTGTANQIDVATGTTTPVLSLDPAINFPGTTTWPTNGAASSSPILITGSIFTGGSATTNFPYILHQPTGTAAVTTWSTAGTLLGANFVSGYTGNVFDIHVAGGASTALLSGAGTMAISGGMTIGGSSAYIFSGNAKILSNGTGNILLESNGSGAISRFVLGNDSASNVALCPSTTTLLVGVGAANCTTLGGVTTGTVKGNLYATGTNCSSSASPAVCAAAAAGSVAIPAGTTQTLQVNTTAVTANSQIILTVDESLGTKLGVTCNTTVATLTQPIVTARSAATSFTIEEPATTATNPVCVSYWVVN